MVAQTFSACQPIIGLHFLKNLFKNTVNLIMNVTKYLFAPWAGILIYSALSFFYGFMGFSAYHQLEKEQQRQEVNIDNLKLINQELKDTMNSLLYDKDTLAVYAREQGFASGAEKFIRIVGLGGSLKTRNSAGEVAAAMDPQYVPDRALRIIALCSGISIFICFAAFDIMKFLRAR